MPCAFVKKWENVPFSLPDASKQTFERSNRRKIKIYRPKFGKKRKSLHRNYWKTIWYRIHTKRLKNVAWNSYGRPRAPNKKQSCTDFMTCKSSSFESPLTSHLFASFSIVSWLLEVRLRHNSSGKDPDALPDLLIHLRILDVQQQLKSQ